MGLFKKNLEFNQGLDNDVLLLALQSFLAGDFSVRLPLGLPGVPGEIASTVNEINSTQAAATDYFIQLFQKIGLYGLSDSRLDTRGLTGRHIGAAVSFNSMLDDLIAPMNEIMKVATAFANGDLSQKVLLIKDGKPKVGYFLSWANTVNYLFEVLSGLAFEVSRVAREVGVEGKLTAQVTLPTSGGAWKEMIESINLMVCNLESEVRAIAEATNAVANGDLSHKITAPAYGDFREIKNTVNGKIDFLNSFASEVSRVVKEIGTEGKLGGRVSVPGVNGIWQELTNNVNQLAANLTEQLRAIHEVANLVAIGDFSQSVSIAVGGEVAELTKKINEMIQNLYEITVKNLEQDWLKSNLVNTTRAVQGHTELKTVAEIALSYLAPLVDAQHCVFYISKGSEENEVRFQMLASCDYIKRIDSPKEWRLGEGLVGQCALEKKPILISNVPNDYITIDPSLEQPKQLNLIVVPVMFRNKVYAVLEFASRTPFTTIQQSLLEQAGISLGVALNTTEGSIRALELLSESQTLAGELQTQQEELQATNQELEEKAQLLEARNLEIERRSHEVEVAKVQVEEKAFQLALTSKYKSDFLSNMSHELRTPLNSLLILAEHLAGNPKEHLDAKEVDFAMMIHESGIELLALINNILDLAKIESGVITVNLAEVPILKIQNQIEKTFRHVAQARGLEFNVIFDSDLQKVIITDEMRLQQVIKNLLSNAFKFTKEGNVTIRVSCAYSGWNSENELLNNADVVFAFTVSDSGIGISTINQQIIFEAFQQEDSGADRKYGGTGLGLSISREIANLLGGELKLVQSALEIGSTFTLFLPCGKIKDVIETSNVSVDRNTTAYVGKLKGKKDHAFNREVLLGKHVLIVDDDRRNLIALTALLEHKGAIVFSEESGRGAINLLNEASDINLILMDIMMPEMDGYETIREIRGVEKFRELPIIALTANAMVGDREKCLEAGASEYLSKPVNVEKLSTLMEECFRN